VVILINCINSTRRRRVREVKKGRKQKIARGDGSLCGGERTKFFFLSSRGCAESECYAPFPFRTRISGYTSTGPISFCDTGLFARMKIERGENTSCVRSKSIIESRQLGRKKL